MSTPVPPDPADPASSPGPDDQSRWAPGSPAPAPQPTGWTAPTQPGWTSPATDPAQPAGQVPPTPRWSAPGQVPPALAWAPAPQPGVVPLRPLTLGDLFDGTFRAIRANPAVMFGFSVAVLAIISVIGALIELPFTSSLDGIVSDPQAAIPDEDDLGQLASWMASTLTGSGISSVLTQFATVILSGMLALSVADAVLGRITPLGETWTRIRPRLLALIGVTILTFLIEFAVLVVGVVIVAAVLVAIVGGGDSSFGWAFLVIVLAVLVLLAVYLFLATRLIFAPISVVLENMGPGRALARSWRLTSSSFWRVLGRNVLISIVTSVAVGIVGGGVGALSALITMATSVGLATVITGVLTGIISGFVLPVTAGFRTLMYIDERIRQENLAPILARAAQEI